ncbi:hypothetical protein ACJX0J_034542, partial [Zea mays]
LIYIINFERRARDNLERHVILPWLLTIASIYLHRPFLTILKISINVKHGTIISTHYSIIPAPLIIIKNAGGIRVKGMNVVYLPVFYHLNLSFLACLDAWPSI